MTATHVTSRYLVVAYVLVVGLWMLRHSMPVEFPFCVLFAITVGLLGTGRGVTRHVVGLAIVQLILALACAAAALAPEPYGTFLIGPDYTAHLPNYYRWFGVPQFDVVPWRIPLLAGGLGVLIVAAARMLLNKSLDGRFLRGGDLSGMLVGGRTFLLMMAVVLGSYSMLGSARLLSFFGVYPDGVAWSLHDHLLTFYLAYIFLFFSCIVLLSVRGSSIPRFLRRPRPLPPLTPRSKGGVAG